MATVSGFVSKIVRSTFFGLIAFFLFPAIKLCAAEDGFVGSGTCAGCHEKQYELWQGSHHDWAMTPATPEYVLGNFDNVTFDHYGDKSRFFRRDERFYVETANARGEKEVFEIAYTFGVEPLQQYLIAFPDGRLQALSLSWDSRPEPEGGQRWFHLYPDERIPHDDVLHWTGTYFNWNSRCAHCHSTNLEKNYDPETNRYDTRWSEINVACEACHGPGESHVEWAGKDEAETDVGNRGLERSLSAMGQWLHSEGESTAQRKETTSPGLDGQLSVCGSCHSRRMLIDDPDLPGHFLDKHQIELINPPQYHADGQILEEVYVMGSFLQSRMYQQGVVCSNCHEPHSLELKAEGNAVCAQCHKPSVYDTQKHHHHPAGNGAQCVNCHMPEKTYMVVDPRRDHSLRIPRPDLSIKLGTPNACTQCHEERSDAWAASAMESWLKEVGKELPDHYGEALATAQTGAADSERRLSQLANREGESGIVRGTALSLLSGQPGNQALVTARENLNDDDPLVRLGALRALEVRHPEQRLKDVFPLLTDPRKVVRLEATRLLNDVPDRALTDSQRAVLEEARDAYVTVLQQNADMPGAQVNLGIFHVARGDHERGERAFRQALVLEPHHLAATMNLADLYRVRNQDAKGEPLLRAILEALPEAAGPHHALGLLLIRQKRYEEAIKFLDRAAELEPTNIRYGYVHAVALTSLGQVAEGLEVLSELHERQPDNLEVLYALVDTHRRAEHWQQALIYAQKVRSLQPGDPRIEQLIRYLKRQ